MAKQSLRVSVLAAVAACAWSLAAHAGVSPDEAAKLKSELTPTGAERAGNKKVLVSSLSCKARKA